MDDQLRVLHLATTDGVAHAFLRPWTQFLRERGVTVGLACNFTDHYHELSQVVDDMLWLEVRPGLSILEDLGGLLDLHYLLRRWHPHILHTHDTKMRLLGQALGRSVGIPLRIHTDYADSTPLPPPLSRLGHHLVTRSGTAGPSRTVIADLGEPTSLPKLYSLYRNLWARHGGLMRRKDAP